MVNGLAGNRLDLEAEVDLHDVLDGLVGLRDEHVKEKNAEEGAALLVCQLQAAMGLGREGELEDRLKHEGRHQVVEKVSRLVHLVAAADD